MTWRGDVTILNRILASLPYLLPIITALSFSGPFFREFPALQVVLLPLIPFITIYTAILSIIPFGLGGLLVFILLFALVVRNESIPHFIRFNTSQSIIIGIAMAIVSILWDYVLAPILGGSFITDIVFNVIFLGSIAACFYSIVLCWIGRYAEIPTLSDAAYAQVR